MPKENIEEHKNIETNQVLVIIVLGRGVCIDAHGHWRPTGLTEVLKNNQHSGIFNRCPNPDDDNAVIAGGNTNTLAAYHLYEQLILAGYPPELIIFAAGRPGYLQDQPQEISEGAVMKDKLLRRLGYEDIPPPETEILTNNKNTRDDIVESLRMLKERGIKQVTFITVKVHTERTAEFIKLAKDEVDGIENIIIDLVAAEDILSDVDPRLGTICDQARESEAYKRTEQREKQGLQDLLDGKYKFPSEGYQFAPRTQTPE